ncbi:MAG: hypothetical protein JXB13_21645 [Phycisphaerae bacterium]|nr:hypothetical protein [Phycisphaerae bacterium]
MSFTTGLVALAVFSVGCVPVLVDKADTVLTIRAVETPDSASIPVGFDFADSRADEDGLVILARGHFPREHETWIFWYPLFTTSHPYPDYDRLLRVTCPPEGDHTFARDCRVQLLLPRDWPSPASQRDLAAYEAALPLTIHRRKRTVSFELSDVRLVSPVDSNQSVQLSGRVLANHRGDAPWCGEYMTDFDDLWNTALSSTNKRVE